MNCSKIEIFNHPMSVDTFNKQVKHYLAELSQKPLKKGKKEYKEAAETLLPLRTFLAKSDYIKHKICVSEKNSSKDKAKIDAELIFENETTCIIQISLAANTHEKEQEFFQWKLRSANLKTVSVYGEIFTKEKDVKKNLIKKIPSLKNISDSDNQQWESDFGAPKMEYYIKEHYEIFHFPCGEKWYQSKDNTRIANEIINNAFERIKHSIEKKLEYENWDILLIGLKDAELFEKDKIELIAKLNTLKNPKENTKIYVAGISYLNPMDCFFYEISNT